VGPGCQGQKAVLYFEHKESNDQQRQAMENLVGNCGAKSFRPLIGLQQFF
jgi:hypothetical protein